VFRSAFIPRILGVALVINGFAYLAISLTGLLKPNYVERVSRIASPALLGEGAIILWLLIKGAKPQRSGVPVEPAPSVREDTDVPQPVIPSITRHRRAG